MSIVYLESAIKNHPNTQVILNKIVPHTIIEIKKYTDILNRKKQNFQLQKEIGNSFILAEKKHNFIMPNPAYCASNLPFNFYFSANLNCPFACEYCFLKGMYESAYPVFFVNTEDFKIAITNKIKEIDANFTEKNVRTMFFSAYDNDSLGFNHLNNFVSDFVPWFKQFDTAKLELRTKSANTEFCHQINPTANTLITWTLSPIEVQTKWEHRTATLEARVKALNLVQSKGFKTAIRLDPIIYFPNWQTAYQNFFDYLEANINFTQIENIFGGFFKMPAPFLKKIQKSHPQSQLLHDNFIKDKNNEMTYLLEKRQEMQKFITNCCQKLGHNIIIFC